MQQLLKSTTWGVSVALSWTWGLGLFFSVQMALHFGLAGLLTFAIPNMLGLMIFGVLTDRIARREGSATRFEKFFFESSHSLRYVVLLYQFVALALTFFAIFAYVFAPLDIKFYLVFLVVLGAAMLVGEQNSIASLRWTHLVMFALMVLAALVIAVGFGGWLHTNGHEARLFDGALPPFRSWLFYGFLAPIMGGLLLGPWLDIQQWQRAIQIRKEEGSIRQSYLIGAVIFFCILLFHGVLALFVAGVGQEELFMPARDGLFHEKDYVVRFFFGIENQYGVGPVIRGAYLVFLCLAILSTLDSGYVALRWFMKRWVARSENIIMTVIPESAVASPVVPVILAAAVGAGGALLGLELEYFMAFYGSFLVGYALIFLFRTSYFPAFTNFAQATLFSVAAGSLGIFGIGYFEEWPVLMALGAVLPLIHGFLIISGRVVVDDLTKALPKDPATDDGTGNAGGASVSGMAAEKAVTALEAAIKRLDPKAAERFHNVIEKVEPTAAQALATVLQAIHADGPAPGAPYATDDMVSAKGHFEGKWFCYTFMATYQDTNSVGNVYFGMYALFVGKVREMFFNVCMPNFDLKNTSFYILTRSFEHKFNMEAKEFEFITVRIRVADFNRKFATLEHEVLNQAQQVLGKGKQVLLFVSSKDYRIVDLPDQVKQAFLPHV